MQILWLRTRACHWVVVRRAWRGNSGCLAFLTQMVPPLQYLARARHLRQKPRNFAVYSQRRRWAAGSKKCPFCAIFGCAGHQLHRALMVLRSRAS